MRIEIDVCWIIWFLVSLVVFVVKFVLWICEWVEDRFLLILFKLWIVDWKWFWSVLRFVCIVLILEIVVLILFSKDDVFVVVDILLVVILRFVVLKLLIEFKLVDDKFIEIVWLVLVLIRNFVEKLLFNILMLLNWVLVVICEILVCSVDIFFWSVWWLVELFMLFCDWIVSVWICCKFVVILFRVFLVVWDKEIVLFVLWMVWFKFWIWDVRWFEICKFVVLFVVLLMWNFDDSFLKDVFKWLFMLKSWCCVLIDDILVFINKDIRLFFRDLMVDVVLLNFFSLN